MFFAMLSEDTYLVFHGWTKIRAAATHYARAERHQDESERSKPQEVGGSRKALRRWVSEAHIPSLTNRITACRRAHVYCRTRSHQSVVESWCRCLSLVRMEIKVCQFQATSKTRKNRPAFSYVIIYAKNITIQQIWMQLSKS